MNSGIESGETIQSCLTCRSLPGRGVLFLSRCGEQKHWYVRSACCLSSHVRLHVPVCPIFKFPDCDWLLFAVRFLLSSVQTKFWGFLCDMGRKESSRTVPIKHTGIDCPAVENVCNLVCKDARIEFHGRFQAHACFILILMNSAAVLIL